MPIDKLKDTISQKNEGIPDIVLEKEKTLLSVRDLLNSNIDSIKIKFAKKKIEELLTNGKSKKISGILLEMLTTRPELLSYMDSQNNPDYLVNLKNKIELQASYYRGVLKEIESVCNKEGVLEVADNPAWFSLKTKDYSNTEKGLNFKVYLTIPIARYDFISKIYQLSKKLDLLAKKTLDKISIKIPNSMLGFLSHNDSIVIHFKNSANKEEIEKILKEWKINNGVIEESRDLGRTKFAIDSSDNSFSQLVANNIEKWFIDNFGKYDNSILIDLALKYSIEQSKKPPRID